MDKITIQKLKCDKHSNKNLKFVQVNDLLTKQNSNQTLFYCSSCFNHDLHFKSINYLMMDQIIQDADTSIIPKWPPQLFAFIDQISFFDQDICQLNQANNSLLFEHDIHKQNNQNGKQKLTSDLIIKLVSNKSNFCSDQFINKLNESLQKINPLLQQFTLNTVFKENKEQIDFSKISEEKLNLIEDYVKHQVFLSNREQQYEKEIKDSQEVKQMILIINSKMTFLSNEFKEQFEKFLIDVKPFLKQIDFTNSFTDQSKFDFFFRSLNDETINNFYLEGLTLKDIELFATKFNNGQTNSLVNKKQNGDFEIQKINNHEWGVFQKLNFHIFSPSDNIALPLVSNKSNFCSDQFINKLNESLQKINPLLQQFTLNTVFKENKEQIDFSKISEEKLNLIEDYVKHQVFLSNREQQYEKEIKDSQEVKQMILIINSKMTFLSNEFKEQFEKFLIDVKPFLKQIDFTNSFTDQSKFDFFFRSLNDETINNFYLEGLTLKDIELFATKYNNGQTNSL
ncbi:hypothetical protein ABPG72_019910, partial [Tetrahymena utriculariae]